MSIFSKKEIDTDSKKIAGVLSRGVEEVFVREILEKKLSSGKQLRIKLGFDPTGAKIHIGRAIILRKLRDFQRLGHKVIFLVGNFTAKIGDPSDKLEKRPMLSDEQIEINLKDYKKQVGKIIDLDKAEFRYNAEWLSKLGFAEIAELAESFSVPQMSNRRNFKDRLLKGEEVSLREFLYPLMQGYDSVALNADVELGGFDQLFNLKAGRTIQRHYGKPEQDVLTTKMLEGTDGRKMSTSWGNVVNITDEPNEMFGKIMSLRDELIPKYFLLCTDLSEVEVKVVEEDLKSGTNPKNIKVRLAKEIVAIYHDKKSADSAELSFEKTFGMGGVPDDVKEVLISKGGLLVDILLENKLVQSKSDFRRLLDGRAVSVVGQNGTIEDPNLKIETDCDIRVGKHRFIRLKMSA